MKLENDKILIEFLGFSPIFFIDKILNLINVKIYSNLSKFEENLKNYFNDNHEEIENGCAAVETLLERSVDSKFDKWELYCLKNILCLPKGAAITSFPHYKDLNLGVTKEDQEQADKELAELRIQRITEKWKRVQLEKKLTQIRARKEQINQIHCTLLQAKKVALESNVYPVDKKVQEIKEMLAQVNQKVTRVEERTQSTNWQSVPLIGTSSDAPFDLAKSVQSEVLYHLNKASNDSPSASAWDVTKDYRETSMIGSAKNIESIALALK